MNWCYHDEAIEPTTNEKKTKREMNWPTKKQIVFPWWTYLTFWRVYPLGYKYLFFSFSVETNSIHKYKMAVNQQNKKLSISNYLCHNQINEINPLNFRTRMSPYHTIYGELPFLKIKTEKQNWNFLHQLICHNVHHTYDQVSFLSFLSSFLSPPYLFMNALNETKIVKLWLWKDLYSFFFLSLSITSIPFN